MDTLTIEQALRREAIRRHLAGERPRDIYRDLHKSRQWWDKWWAAFRYEPQTDFADHSRMPLHSPQRISPAVEQLIVSLRRAREARRTPETRYGFIGHRAIQSALLDLQVEPLPSLASIQRILQRHGLTHPWGAAKATAHYPWLVAWEPNAIHATDIITRHLRGGLEIQNYHTIDHFSHAVHASQSLDKSSQSACAHLLENWADLGLPSIQQFDNESCFCGGHTHPRVIGRVVRLCLFCGIEPLFIPEYEPKRNYQVETFHSVWLAGFWSSQRFRNIAHVQAEWPTFRRYYHQHYRPPSLDGQTPAQRRRGFRPRLLTRSIRRLIPAGRLPITQGRIHVIRQVDQQGLVTFLNEAWPVGQRWIGQYVWAIIDTKTQTVGFWHLPAANKPWQHIKTRGFRLPEPVQPLLPAFRKNCLRCREHLPG
jgi:putative transposase